jgi:hypothetical protein
MVILNFQLAFNLNLEKIKVLLNFMIIILILILSNRKKLRLVIKPNNLIF